MGALLADFATFFVISGDERNGKLNNEETNRLLDTSAFGYMYEGRRARLARRIPYS